jgi:RNA polymerase sigma factor (sigma-70 family)
MRFGKQPAPATRRESSHIRAGRSVEAETARVRADFITFYDGEYLRVVFFLIRCGASLQCAEDAAQEAFVEAWTLAERGDWDDIAGQRGWIRTVALRKYRRPPERRRAMPLVLPVAECPDVLQPGRDCADLTAETQFVVEVLRSLDPELQAIMAFDLDGFTTGEVADLLGLTEQQVRDRRKKARRILAVMLAGAKAQDREAAR